MDIKKCKHILRGMYSVLMIEKARTSGNGSINNKAADLIRLSHSIEKGLSISNPRLGFGHEKQKEMMRILEHLKDKKMPYVNEAKEIALCALKQYIRYHKERQYNDEVNESIELFLSSYSYDDLKEHNYAGVLTLCKKDCTFNVEDIEHFFNSRHSIREFSGEKVDDQLISKALLLAQRAPSACNRQGIRAYVLSEENSKKIATQLTEIGGFAEDVDRYILITGKLSAYSSREQNQFIVSSGIYAGYLSLTLHLYGIGACIIQRPVTRNRKWDEIREWLHIDTDEQLVCMMGIGMMKDECAVPISHRLKFDTLFRFI